MIYPHGPPLERFGYARSQWVSDWPGVVSNRIKGGQLAALQATINGTVLQNTL